MRNLTRYAGYSAPIAICWMLSAPWFARQLIVERQLLRADAIVILAGSATYRDRCKKAAESFQLGVSSNIFLTDDKSLAGWSRIDQRTLPFAELARRQLINDGIPPTSIHLFPEPVESTADEAQLVARAIEKNSWKSVLLVTSAYHTSRALRTFERAISAGNTIAELGVVYAPLGHESPQPSWWWISSAGWRDVAWEYVKSVYYIMFY